MRAKYQHPVIRTILILFFVALFSCQQQAETTTNAIPQTERAENVDGRFRKKQFAAMVGRIRPVSLPFMFKLWEDDVIALPAGPADTLFVSPYHRLVGYLPDTSRYVAVIAMAPADALLPFLYTFDKMGNPIAKEQLALGYCGPDCGLVCDEYTQISNNLEILLMSKSIQYPCEDDDHVDSGVWVTKTMQKARITDDGQVIKEIEATQKYEPDTLELAVSGWQSRHYSLETPDFNYRLSLRADSDSSLQYDMRLEELSMGCELRFHGTAALQCRPCEAEPQTASGRSFIGDEYVIADHPDFLRALWISQEKKRAKAVFATPHGVRDECISPLADVVLQQEIPW